MIFRTAIAIAVVLGVTLVAGLGAGFVLLASDDPPGKEGPKGPYHDTMEEIEELYLAVKDARADVDKYPELALKAKAMQPLFEKVIPWTEKRLKELGTAKAVPQFLEAKALLVESLAHAIGLEAALLKKDPEAVKKRLRKLNSVKNEAHREFQP